MNQTEFRALLYSMLMQPAGESMMPQDNELKATLACILIQAKKFGDPSRLEYFTNRLFGKVPDKVEVSEGEKLKQLTDIELYEVAKEQIKELEKKLFATKGKEIGSTEDTREEE